MHSPFRHGASPIVCVDAESLDPEVRAKDMCYMSVRYGLHPGFLLFFFLLGLHGYKETLEQFSVGEIDLKFPKFEIEHLLLTLE